MILLVYCAGGLGKEVMDLAEIINANQKRWSEVAFIDDICGKKEVYHKKVYTYEEAVEKFSIADTEIVIANGEPMVRKKLYDKIVTDGYNLATLIHPKTEISPSTKVGRGVVFKGETIISCDCEIGDNVYFQPFTTVGHDAVIGGHSVVSCFSVISGLCQVDERVYISPGSVIKDNIRIGTDAIIGIGTVVVRNVKDESIIFGNPGKKIGTNDKKSVFGRFV